MMETFDLNTVYAAHEPLMYINQGRSDRYYIDTNILATEVNVAIFDSIMGQMSDGIWENSRAMEKYWRGMSFLRSKDNHIVVCYNKYLSNFGASRLSVMRFLANKIKQIVKICIDDGCWNQQMEWKRNCQADCAYLNRGSQLVKISDAYKVYDQLLQRDINKYHY